MISSNLRKTYKEQYTDFYKSNFLAISLPLLFNRTGWWLPNKELISIKKKLPVRIHIWIQKSADSKCELWNITYFDQDHNNFVTSSLLWSLSYMNSIQNNITQYIKWTRWYKINIFSEINPIYGLDFEPLAVFAIILIIFIYQWKIQKSDIDLFYSDENILTNISQWNLSEVFNITENIIDKNFKYYTIFSAYASGIHSNYPLVKYHTTVTSFSSLVKSKQTKPHIPLDYIVVYSWEPVLSEDRIEWDRLSPIITSKKRIQNIMNNDIPIKEWSDHIYELIKDIHTWVVISLKDLYESNSEYNKTTWCVNALNKLKLLQRVVCNNHRKFMNIIDVFFEQYSQRYRNIASITHNNTRCWWCFMIAIPWNVARKELLNTFNNLKLNNNGVHMTHISRMDGDEYEWLRIEQDIGKWIIAKEISRIPHKMTMNNGYIVVGDNFSLRDNEDCDIIADSVDESVFIQWSRLYNKRKIYSITAIIKLLKLMCEEPKHSYTKEELQSYGISWLQRKSDIDNKIVKPLNDCLKNRTGKKIKISYEWVGESYTLKYDCRDIRIGVIEPLHES